MHILSSIHACNLQELDNFKQWLKNMIGQTTRQGLDNFKGSFLTYKLNIKKTTTLHTKDALRELTPEP